MFKESLTELANRYGSDKGTSGPSVAWGAHNYTDVYEGYLSKYRSSPTSILEIGIGVTGKKWDAQVAHGRNQRGGASLMTWRDYFPNGEIYGIDVNDARHLEGDRLRTFVVDQGNIAEMKEFLGKFDGLEFDFIIDDGSHRPDHQQISFGLLFPRLKSEGVYFIEDLGDNGFGDGATGRHSSNLAHNTRKLLRAFRETGQFLEPNSLIDPDYLKEHIGQIAFHVPERFVAPRKTWDRLLGRKPLPIQYKQHTEKLCAIRKK